MNNSKYENWETVERKITIVLFCYFLLITVITSWWHRLNRKMCYPLDKNYKIVIVLIICCKWYKDMYEEHTIKCSSCGKLFISKENETVCNECYKKLENIKFWIQLYNHSMYCESQFLNVKNYLFTLCSMPIQPILFINVKNVTVEAFQKASQHNKQLSKQPKSVNIKP